MTQIDQLKSAARRLIAGFKGDAYAYGPVSLDQTGVFARGFGKRSLVIANHSGWLQPTVAQVQKSLEHHGVEIVDDKIVPGSRPNSPADDVYRMALYIADAKPDCIVAVGGGSTIDAVKAAIVAACFAHIDPELEHYYGMGLVKQRMDATGTKLIPMIAVMTASGSGAHLTKYANVTDFVNSQKKLIIDDAVTPQRAVFDYRITASSPRDVTLDGAFDGLAHCLEVFYGIGEAKYELAKEIAQVGIELIVQGITGAIEDPGAEEALELLGLATDLGAYAIMVGGTNGAHLNSFSLVDIMTHGRACAVMNPYYTVFFAPAIERQLRVVGDIYRRHGYISSDLDSLKGRELGIAVAEGMRALSRRIGFPTTLSQIPGFGEEHVARALSAAKNPQLESKLRNMPLPMTAADVDGYMGPVLRAAQSGDLNLIENK